MNKKKKKIVVIRFIDYDLAKISDMTNKVDDKSTWWQDLNDGESIDDGKKVGTEIIEVVDTKTSKIRYNQVLDKE
eukprot:CAMPEP_0176400668 /NCGR_PEP_ID=MMETSP0126-20121128/47792_1 /TAXON_ID=141414 ORGANISM="Strombidinopsis acuminatum, Strain SPMC142" /NCGR_SAMPLE_ID=MMETSP0126 /ASSEMBLY_ACC=CAM_ASM_000229 /LENGTH=74 /DNA_ID=CAMNT_0017777083 /DNA_START=405 /DNA_END=629 /DNA_ORIENTATION=-